MQFGVYINVQLRNISWLYCRVQDYIENGRDKMLVDPDPDEIYTRRKVFECSTKWSCLSCHLKCEIPGRWMGKVVWKDAVFHESQNEPARGKFWNANRKCWASLNSNQFKKVKTFLKDEYLKEIEANSDQRYFYLKAKCYHSFRKSEAPHDLRFTMCIVSGQVIHANCSCKAGKVGYCNHVLALMFKACKFSLFDSKSTEDLCQEDDEQPDLACTSQLQKWHKKGHGSKYLLNQ